MNREYINITEIIRYLKLANSSVITWNILVIFFSIHKEKDKVQINNMKN